MKIKLVWTFVLLTALPGAAAQAVPEAPQLCHIANAGFALRTPEGTVLIDALFRNGLPDYQRASDELNEKMETGAPPFDDVELVIVSHVHPDHFDANALARHAQHNPRANYLVTPQVRERMLAAAPAGIDGDRVRAVYPANDETRIFRYQDITATVFPISHGKGSSAQNIGVLVETGGLRLFHTGDMEPYADELIAAGLQNLEVDVVLLPFWALLSGESRKLMAGTFAAGTVIPMHLPVMEQDWMAEYGGLAGLRKRIESSVANGLRLTEEMACRTMAATAME